MSNIPPDIYERVHELAVAIANASAAGDDALYDSLCQTICIFCDEQAGLGRSHPFLTETMADYTSDPAEATTAPAGSASSTDTPRPGPAGLTRTRTASAPTVRTCISAHANGSHGPRSWSWP